MEYIEILNEYGINQGQILSRDETHKQGLWHKGFIGVLVNSDDEVLMQQRSNEKDKFPGMWDLSAAGHVIAGEDAYSALIRELSEEIGAYVTRDITAKNCRFLESFKNIHTYFDKKLNQQVDEKCWYALFMVKIEQDINSFKFNDNEVKNVKWLSIYDIKKLKNENKLHPRTEWIEIVERYLNNVQ